MWAFKVESNLGHFSSPSSSACSCKMGTVDQTLTSESSPPVASLELSGWTSSEKMVKSGFVARVSSGCATQLGLMTCIPSDSGSAGTVSGRAASSVEARGDDASTLKRDHALSINRCVTTALDQDYLQSSREKPY